jgi:hypothetical protein
MESVNSSSPGAISIARPIGEIKAAKDRRGGENVLALNPKRFWVT